MHKKGSRKDIMLTQGSHRNIMLTQDSRRNKMLTQGSRRDDHRNRCKLFCYTSATCVRTSAREPRQLHPLYTSLEAPPDLVNNRYRNVCNKVSRYSLWTTTLNTIMILRLHCQSHKDYLVKYLLNVSVVVYYENLNAYKRRM